MNGVGPVLNKLRTMSAAEISTRAATGARRGMDRLRWSVRPPRWRREELADALADTPDLTAVSAHLRAAEWMEAHRDLQAHFTDRAPRFLLHPASREHLSLTIRTHFAGAAHEAALRADRALDGRLDVLGYPDLCFAAQGGASGDIDWHRDPVHGRMPPWAHWSQVPFLNPACGDHKIIWELNRHQHWLALGRAYWLTGDERYRAGFVRQLQSWLASNPPASGANWASMLEIALRCVSWIWALHFFVRRLEPSGASAGAERQQPWTVDLLLGLHHQLSLVERNLSTYFSPNTHLLGEGLGLYVAGQCLPELRRSARWAQQGRDILLAGIERQVLADGAHVELSLHYHRYTFDFYTLALAVARATGDRPAHDRFADAVRRLALFTRTMADSDYRLPHIGDDDGGMLFPIGGADADNVRDSLAIAAALLRTPELSDGGTHEAVAWMTGTLPAQSGPPAPLPSTVFPAAGYVVSRTGGGDHMVMDVGRLGFLNGGHAHADALSLTLNVSGHRLVIDPGTGCYTVDPAVRDRFRTTPYHNTVTIDGRSQSQPVGAFHWSSVAHVSLDAWRAGDAFSFVEGQHDGYRPVTHHRQVLARRGCWLVADWVLGTSSLHAATHWHLDPAWAASVCAPGIVRTDHPSGARVWFLTLGGAIDLHRASREGLSLGWCSPVYGAIVPTTTLRLERQAAPPFAMITVIVESVAQPRLELPGSPVMPGEGSQGMALTLHTASWTDIISLAMPGAPRRRRQDGGVDTDARCVCLRADQEGTLTDAWMVDGTTLSMGDRLLVGSPEPLTDLHVAWTGGTSRVASSMRTAAVRVDRAPAGIFHDNISEARG